MYDFLCAAPPLAAEGAPDDDVVAADDVAAADPSSGEDGACGVDNAVRAGSVARVQDRLAVARAKARAERAESAMQSVLEASQPNLRRQTSRVFGFQDDAGNIAHARARESRMLGDADTVFYVNASVQERALRDRAVSSHVSATRQELPRWLADPEVIAVSSVIDDATLWMRLPMEGDAEKAQEARAKRRAVKAKAKAAATGRPASRGTFFGSGRNKATTVLSMVNHVYLKRRLDRGACCAQLHAPAQALPRANWRTIADRKDKWSLWDGAHVGAAFKDADGEVQQKMDSAAAVLSLSTHDAASVNSCVVAREEILSEHSSTDEKVHLVFHMHCMAHQASLATRHGTASVSDLGTTLVRLGHILAGARNFSKYLRCLRDVVARNFSYKRVLAVPLEDSLIRARRRLRWCFEASKISFDIESTEIQDVLRFFNGNHESTEMVHFVLPVPATRAHVAALLARSLWSWL